MTVALENVKNTYFDQEMAETDESEVVHDVSTGAILRGFRWDLTFYLFEKLAKRNLRSQENSDWRRSECLSWFDFESTPCWFCQRHNAIFSHRFCARFVLSHNARVHMLQACRRADQKQLQIREVFRDADAFRATCTKQSALLLIDVLPSRWIVLKWMFLTGLSLSPFVKIILGEPFLPEINHLVAVKLSSNKSFFTRALCALVSNGDLRDAIIAVAVCEVPSLGLIGDPPNCQLILCNRGNCHRDILENFFCIRALWQTNPPVKTVKCILTEMEHS